MAGEVEALGAFTTAGLAASAIDPARAHGRADVRADTHADATCANCGTALVGDYCHACGQQGHVHRSIGHIVEEFLHGIWHFDSKAWRTLPLLVFRPGRLTWDYVHGKRARFIAPLALFLLTVFLMFFVFGFVGGPDVDGALNAANDNTTKAEKVAAAREAVVDARGEVADAQGEITGAKADPDTPPTAVTALAIDLTAKQAALAATERALAKVEATPVAAAGADNAPHQRWQDQLRLSADSPRMKINLGNDTLNERVREALRNPDFALYRIQQKAYKLSFLLVPLSLPTLWLMFFWRRDVRTFDHVVFALYSLSFMSLLFVVIALLMKADGQGWGNFSTIAGFLFFAPPLHMFAQLKGGYRLSTIGALWRTVVLSMASVVTLSMFAVMIVLVGLAD